MKKYSSSLILVSVIMLVLMCTPVLLYAQDPGCDPSDPLCPIDGGLVFLLATGVAYGIKKTYPFLKKNTLAASAEETSSTHLF